MLNDEYNMPHWINLSFYSSKQRFSSTFIPRIKMPNISPTEMNASLKKSSNFNLPSFINHSHNHHQHQKRPHDTNSNGIDLTSCQNIAFIDYDEHDNQIFRTSLSNKQFVFYFKFD